MRPSILSTSSKRRRSSRNILDRGKSDFIDYSMMLLENLLNTNGDITYIQNEMNNNTLPCEIRSIVWRVFLKILPKNDISKWVKITKDKRDIYKDRKKSLKSSEFLHDIIINHKKILPQDIEKCEELKFAEEALEFINDQSEIYDLFKQSFVKEVIVFNYVIYRINTNKFNFSSAPFLSILASVVYALYSSISNLEIEVDDLIKRAIEGETIELNEIMRYHTLELFFEADVFTVFESLMEHHSIREVIINLNKECSVSENIYTSEYNTLNCSLMELTMLIINTEKPELIKYMIENQLDLNMVFKYWLSTFFSSSFTYIDCTFLMDAILCNEEQIKNEEVELCFISNRIKLHFTYFIIGSLITILSESIMKIKDLKELNDFLLVLQGKQIDLKYVVMKALKNREAMSLIYNK